MTLRADVFAELPTPKEVFRWMSKKFGLKRPSYKRHGKQPKHCWNLQDSTFMIFIHHCKGNWVLKSLSEWYAKAQDCLLTHWLIIANILVLIRTL